MPRIQRSSAPPHDLGGVPLDAPAPRRTRLRRGGPRTPLPLLPLIAGLAGVGVAYVNQSAHSTQAAYHAAALAGDNQRLRDQDVQLGDELARLESTARIVAAAQKLGMRPAGSWSYLDAPLKPVVDLPAPVVSGQQRPEDPLQRFVAALGGAVGVNRDTGPRR